LQFAQIYFQQLNMTVMPVEQNFPEFVAKEVINGFYYVTGLFTLLTSLCEFGDEEEDTVSRREFVPSEELIKEEKETKPVKKGLFAMSFEKIPCDQPIKACQYRTGRRYITADNFPQDDALDFYLGLMEKTSSCMKLKTDDSTLSFDFATEDHLEFQIMSEECAELFPELDQNMMQALKAYYPHQVDFLNSEDLNASFIQTYFTLPTGEEDLGTLEELCIYLRALTSEGKKLARHNSQVTPKEYEAILEQCSPSDLPFCLLSDSDDMACYDMDGL